MTALVVVEALAIVLLGILVAGLLRSHAEILRSLHQLGVGLDDEHDHGNADFSVQPGIPEPGRASTGAHDLAGVTPDDETVALGVVGAGHSTLLAFLSSGCLTCASFWRAFRDEASLGLPADARLVIATKGPEDESESEIAKLAPAGVDLVMSSAAWDDYAVPGSPYFVYVDGPSGRIVGEGAATSWEQVSSLLGQALGDTGRRRSRARVHDDAARQARADSELTAAGIYPGHPSLYGTELALEAESEAVAESQRQRAPEPRR
jgi:hypothetical protein